MWPNGKAFDWNSKDSGFDPQHGHEANNSKFLFFFFGLGAAHSSVENIQRIQRTEKCMRGPDYAGEIHISARTGVDSGCLGGNSFRTKIERESSPWNRPSCVLTVCADRHSDFSSSTLCLRSYQKSLCHGWMDFIVVESRMYV